VEKLNEFHIPLLRIADVWVVDGVAAKKITEFKVPSMFSTCFDANFGITVETADKNLVDEI
jgi:hypothetical protein